MCAGAIINHFLRKLNAGDTRCAKRPHHAFAGVGVFSRRAGHSSVRIARIATATIIDVLQRSFLGADPRGVGLRGGTFHAKETRTGLTLHLAAARLTEDVAVTGDATYDGTLDADLSVAGAAQGTLHVHGIWNEPGATRLVVNGQLDGHQIGISVPAT